MTGLTVDYGKHEFTVRRVILAQLTAQAAVAVPSRESLAVHGSFRVTVDPGRLELAATDSQLTVLAATKSVETQSEAVLFLPAKRLKQIIDAAPDGDVTISVSGNMARVKAGGPSWDMKMPHPRGYSTLIDPASVTFSSVPRESFLAALLAVRHAVCKDVSRPHYAQVQLAKDGGDVWATAFDGPQLCRARVPGFPFETTLPAAMLPELVKLIEHSKAEDIEVGEVAGDEASGTVVVRTGHTVLACQLMGAEFPNVQQLMLDPTAGNDQELGVDGTELARAVRRVAVNAHPTTSAMALSVDGQKLAVQAQDDDDNKAEEVIGCTWGGDKRLLVVNHRHLSEMLAVHPPGTCTFRLGADVGRRRSMVRLEDEASGMISVIPQMSPSAAGR
jgi:DNA polymerase III sliding clamp (beta) subunit (PCNA family)